MNKLKEIQYYNNRFPGRLKNNLLFYFSFDSGSSIINSITGKTGISQDYLFSGQILPETGNFWLNSGTGFIQNNYIKINNTNNLINYQNFSFVCVYENISQTGATLLSTVGQNVVTYKDKFGVSYNTFVNAGFEFGFTANNRLFFEFYDANGPKVFTSNFDLADKASVFLNVANRSLSFGYYDYTQNKIISNTFNFNSQFILNPTGGLFIGKNPLSTNLYNYNKQFEGYLEQMVFCSPTLYQYEIENLSKSFVSNYISGGNFYNETLLTGITGKITGSLGEEILLTGFLYGVTGYKTGIIGVNTGVQTGIQLIPTGSYIDKFGNIEIDYQEVPLFGDIILTGFIPLTGVLRSIKSGIIKEGIYQDSNSIGKFGKSNLNILSDLNNEDIIDIQIISDNYDSKKSKNLTSFYDKVSKNYVFQKIKSEPENTNYILFANGLLMTSGSRINIGDIYSPSILISGGDYIRIKKGEFLFSNFDNSYNISADLFSGSIIVENNFSKNNTGILNIFNINDYQIFLNGQKLTKGIHYNNKVNDSSNYKYIITGTDFDPSASNPIFKNNLILIRDNKNVLIYTGSMVNGWNLKQRLPNPSSISNNFGFSFNISENNSTIAVGAPGEGTFAAQSGAIFVYTGDIINGWNFKQKLTGISFIQPTWPYVGGRGSQLGYDVYINYNGSLIIGGQPYDQEGGLEEDFVTAGGALIFTGNNIDGWKFKQKLLGNSGDLSSKVVSNYDNTILALNGRDCKIYTGDSNLGWIFKQKITGTDSDSDIAINKEGSKIFLGNNFLDPQSLNVGSIYIYTGLINKNWNLDKIIINYQTGNNLGFANSRFGSSRSITLSENNILSVFDSKYGFQDIRDNNDGIDYYGGVSIYSGDLQNNWNLIQFITGSGAIYENGFVKETYINHSINSSGNALIMTSNNLNSVISEINDIHYINNNFTPLFTILGENISGKLVLAPNNFNENITGLDNLYKLNYFLPNYSQVYKNGIRQTLNFDYIENNKFNLNNGRAILDIKNNSIYNNNILFR